MCDIYEDDEMFPLYLWGIETHNHSPKKNRESITRFHFTYEELKQYLGMALTMIRYRFHFTYEELKQNLIAKDTKAQARFHFTYEELKRHFHNV